MTSHRISHGTWYESLATSLNHASAPSAADGTIAQLDYFGTPDRLAAAVGKTPSPTKVVAFDGSQGGMQIRSIGGIDVQPVLSNGKQIGIYFEDAHAGYGLLGGIYPADCAASPAVQTDNVFSRIEAALAGVGMDFRHVARTWFYNDRILEWYADFNLVRTSYFREHGISLMPASTAIGAPNADGAALVAKVLAVRPKSDAVRVGKAVSPLQHEAFAYGSAFSRAIEVTDPFARSIYISGTASIDLDGQTVHIGDAAGQIAKTMEVVQAILETAGMTLRNATRGVAYFRNPADIPLWREFCRRHGCPDLPVIEVGSVVCRDNLLFELELDASIGA